jgi:hypothetical protein
VLVAARTPSKPLLPPIVLGEADAVEWADITACVFKYSDPSERELHAEMRRHIHPRVCDIYKDLRLIGLYQTIQWRQMTESERTTIDLTCIKSTYLINYSILCVPSEIHGSEGGLEECVRVVALIYTTSTNILARKNDDGLSKRLRNS